MTNYNIHLITFANKEPFIKSQKILNSTYKNCGISTHTMWNQYLIYNSKFYHDNINIFEKYKSIGFGLFIWKPYIILEKMKQISNDEFIYYQDSSRYDFENLNIDFNKICDFMNKNNIDIIPGFEINCMNKLLIKEECLNYMQINNNDFLNKYHIHTSPMIIKKTLKTLNFIEDWLKYCQIPECIIKNTNFHQCDQAIFNILLDKYNFKPILFSDNKEQSKKHTFFWKKIIEYIDNN